MNRSFLFIRYCPFIEKLITLNNNDYEETDITVCIKKFTTIISVLLCIDMNKTVDSISCNNNLKSYSITKHTKIVCIIYNKRVITYLTNKSVSFISLLNYGSAVSLKNLLWFKLHRHQLHTFDTYMFLILKY